MPSDTPGIPNPADIDSWPSAIVTIVLLLLVIGLPSLLSYLGNLQTKAVARSLSETNGGSSVKDALNRIELQQQAQGESLTLIGDRVGVLEAAIELTTPAPAAAPGDPEGGAA